MGYNLIMTEIIGFFLIAFVTICFARTIARIFRIPTLIIYIIAGIISGPSGLNLIKDTASLQYFYELGIILLMFSAGLELKIHHIPKEKSSLGLLCSFNMLIPGICGFVFGLFIAKYFYIGNEIYIALYMVTLISSPASEVIVQLFREFLKKIDYKKKMFSQYLVLSSIIADITSLFLFTGIVAYFTAQNLYGLLKFILFFLVFFVIVFKILPALQGKILNRITRIKSSEEETTTILMAVVMVVFIGTFLHIPAIVCAFSAGISLANIHINRRVQHNIDFLTSSIFVPIVFIIIGTQVNLTIFRFAGNSLLATSILLYLILVRSISLYIAARMSDFSAREAAGFGFSTIPQLTGALAIAVASFELGIIPEALFNSIVIVSIITTIIGPFLSRILLFPGLATKQEKTFIVEDFAHFDIKPFNLLTSIYDMGQKIKDTELSIYPVTDRNGMYKGVVHLEDLKDAIFDREMARLIIAADILDDKYPYIEKDATIKEAMEFFSKPHIYALVVVEMVEGIPVYEGLLLLHDILPEIHKVSQ